MLSGSAAQTACTRRSQPAMSRHCSGERCSSAHGPPRHGCDRGLVKGRVDACQSAGAGLCCGEASCGASAAACLPLFFKLTHALRVIHKGAVLKRGGGGQSRHTRCCRGLPAPRCAVALALPAPPTRTRLAFAVLGGVAAVHHVAPHLHACARMHVVGHGGETCTPRWGTVPCAAASAHPTSIPPANPAHAHAPAPQSRRGSSPARPPAGWWRRSACAQT